MTYTEAIQFLYGLRLFGAKLGLENSFKLAALAGNPHERLRFIHVAGTNGKGSTCAMLESVYQGAGLRVGLFTSPHLVSFRERIQVNRQLISEADVIRLVEKARSLLVHFAAECHPTFFEVITLMALCYFLEQECDLVIWETGLGGRLDATNIVTPLASIITNIQLDHEKWLGSTLAQIAFEKSGIIKPKVPVLTAADEPEAFDVIRQMAARQQAPLTRVTLADTAQPPLDTTTLPLLGDHQRMNAALAAATVRILQPLWSVPDPVLRIGLERVQWLGRLQRHVTAGGRMVLLDGAHNPAGAECLRKAVERHFPSEKPAIILGILRDKDWAAMCQILAPLGRRLLVAPVHSERTTLPNELREASLNFCPALEIVACSSLPEALDRTKDDRVVLITGSLHFVGEAIEWLGLMSSASGERSLNDWNAAAPEARKTTGQGP